MTDLRFWKTNIIEFYAHVWVLPLLDIHPALQVIPPESRSLRAEH